MQEDNKIKIAIVGAGQEGLETLSVFKKDKAVSVSMLLDTDEDALGFRLGEYGYAYSDDLNLRLSHRIRELNTIQHLNLIVDTASERDHKAICDLNIYPAEIINGYAARFIWEIKYIEDIEKRRAFISDHINSVIGTLNRGLKPAAKIHSVDEHSALLLRTAFLSTRANAAQLTILEKNNTYKIIKDINIDHNLIIKKGVSRNYIKEQREEDKIIRQVVESRGIWEGVNGDVRGWGTIRVIPLIEGSDVVGLLWLFYVSATADCVKDDAAFISSLMPLLGGTIRSTIESEDLRVVSAEKALSAEPLNIIRSDKPIELRLKEINNFLFKLLEAEDSHLYIRDPATGDLVLQATTNKFPYLLGDICIRRGQGVLGEVVERSRPIILKEASIDDEDGDGVMRRFAKREDNITLLYLPLIANDKGVGVIAMEFINAWSINSSTYKHLVNTGNHLGNTISSDAERYRMSQKIIKLSTVNEEGIELLSTTDLQKVLALSTASSAMLLDSAVSILRLYENGKLIVQSTYGIHEDKADQDLLHLDDNISSIVSQAKIPVVIHDLLEYSEMTSDNDFPYKTAISMPIFVNKEFFGTLSLYNKKLSGVFSSIFFTDDDREILEHYIHYVARGIVNAKRYNERQLLITIDDITGLRNERYLQMRFPEEIKRAKRFNRYLSLIFFEVKPFNDNVISEMTNLIKETFRYIDVLVRLKEAKFAALLPDTGEGVKDAVNRLSAGFNKLKEKMPELILYTGYATYPDDSKDMHELIKKSSRLHQH